MRLFIFSWNFQLGGVQKHTILLANQLVTKGVQVTILYNNKVGPLLKTLDHNVRLKKFIIPNSNNPFKLYQLAKNLSQVIPVGSAILCNGPNNFRQVSRLNAIMKSWKILYVLHNDLIFRKGIKGLFHLLEMKFLCQSRNTNIISLSKNQKLDHEKRLKIQGLQVIPNFIKNTQSKVCEKSNDEMNAIVIGRYSDEKGLEDLVESLKFLKYDLKIDVYGNGHDYREFLSELLINKGINCVSLNDEITNSSELLCKYDFLILPSRRETFGLVIIEAFSSGLPVVATDCDGPLDIVNINNGVLVKKENPESLANGIMEMIIKIEANYFNGHSIRKNAEKYSVEVVSDQYLNLLTK